MNVMTGLSEIVSDFIFMFIAIFKYCKVHTQRLL